MLVAITGTPGTGKTSVSKILEKKGYKILDLNTIAKSQGFIIGKDKERNSEIVDIDKLNKYFDRFKSDETVFIDSHLSHFISDVDKVILLRGSPDKLKRNLKAKNWPEKKIKENIESEILDIILSETVEIHDIKDIFEIDTTDYNPGEVAEKILTIVEQDFKNIKNYKIGKIDWSEEILKDF